MLSILPLLTLERAGTEVQMTPLLNYTRAVLALSCLKHKRPMDNISFAIQGQSHGSQWCLNYDGKPLAISKH